MFHSAVDGCLDKRSLVVRFGCFFVFSSITQLKRGSGVRKRRVKSDIFYAFVAEQNRAAAVFEEF